MTLDQVEFRGFVHQACGMTLSGNTLVFAAKRDHSCHHVQLLKHLIFRLV